MLPLFAGNVVIYTVERVFPKIVSFWNLTGSYWPDFFNYSQNQEGKNATMGSAQGEAIEGT